MRAAMRLDDLLGDAEAETGMGAEFLAGRALGIEAVEDRFELVRRNAGALILDTDAHGGPRAGRRCGSRRRAG